MNVTSVVAGLPLKLMHAVREVYNSDHLLVGLFSVSLQNQSLCFIYTYTLTNLVIKMNETFKSIQNDDKSQETIEHWKRCIDENLKLEKEYRKIIAGARNMLKAYTQDVKIEANSKNLPNTSVMSVRSSFFDQSHASRRLKQMSSTPKTT